MADFTSAQVGLNGPAVPTQDTRAAPQPNYGAQVALEGISTLAELYAQGKQNQKKEAASKAKEQADLDKSKVIAKYSRSLHAISTKRHQVKGYGEGQAKMDSDALRASIFMNHPQYAPDIVAALDKESKALGAGEWESDKERAEKDQRAMEDTLIQEGWLNNEDRGNGVLIEQAEWRRRESKMIKEEENKLRSETNIGKMKSQAAFSSLVTRDKEVSQELDQRLLDSVIDGSVVLRDEDRISAMTKLRGEKAQELSNVKRLAAMHQWDSAYAEAQVGRINSKYDYALSVFEGKVEKQQLDNLRSRSDAQYMFSVSTDAKTADLYSTLKFAQGLGLDVKYTDITDLQELSGKVREEMASKIRLKLASQILNSSEIGQADLTEATGIVEQELSSLALGTNGENLAENLQLIKNVMEPLKASGNFAALGHTGVFKAIYEVQVVNKVKPSIIKGLQDISTSQRVTNYTPASQEGSLATRMSMGGGSMSGGRAAKEATTQESHGGAALTLEGGKAVVIDLATNEPVLTDQARDYAKKVNAFLEVGASMTEAGTEEAQAEMSLGKMLGGRFLSSKAKGKGEEQQPSQSQPEAPSLPEGFTPRTAELKEGSALHQQVAERGDGEYPVKGSKGEGVVIVRDGKIVGFKKAGE